MLIPSTPRKNALFVTEQGMLEMDYAKLAEDRETCLLPSLQEYAIYAAGPVACKSESAGLVGEAAGLSSEITYYLKK